MKLSPSVPVLIAAFCGLLPIVPCSAADHFVDAATGNDSNPGSAERPVRSLNKAVSLLAPGDRILLAPGIYRETVVVSATGTKESPVVIESKDPAMPAIISGADAIPDWKPLAGAAIADPKSNPNAANIFYADIDWTPDFLFAGANKQAPARQPNTGWYPASTDGKSITSDNLTDVHAASLDGAKIYFFRASKVSQATATITGWSGGAKGTSIDLAEAMFRGEARYYTDGDRFFMFNHLAFLDRAGEWVAVPNEKGARVFWWPPSREDLAKAEGTRRPVVLDLGQSVYVTVRNLHIRHGAPNDNGFGIGFDNVDLSQNARIGITIDSCAIYQNQRFGLAMRGVQDAIVTHCLIVDNSYGASTSRSRNVLFEENEIAWNLNDGLVVAWDIEDVIVRRNAIHHHSRFAHPDNFQTYRGVKNVLLDSNVLVASGQSAHNQQAVDIVARNNIIAGASANEFFVSGEDTKNTGTQKDGGGYTLENNTFTLFANGAVIISGTGHTMQGNVFDLRGGKYAYGSNSPASGLTSRNNRFFITQSTHNLIGSFESKRYKNLEDLQSETGIEQESVYGEPQFPSVPERVLPLDGKQIALCTESLLYVEGGETLSPGTHIEYDFDGVDRVVKEISAGGIVIHPPLKEAPITTVLLCDWGQRKVGRIDLTTKDKRGSTVNFEAYLRGDFNNDGKRDVPPWPEVISSPRSPK